MTMRAISRIRSRARSKGQSGQTTTEYMMVISVVVIALAFLSHDALMPAFESGTKDFKNKMEPAAEKGVFGEPGKMR